MRFLLGITSAYCIVAGIIITTSANCPDCPPTPEWVDTQYEIAIESYIENRLALLIWDTVYVGQQKFRRSHQYKPDTVTYYRIVRCNHDSPR